MKSKTFNRLNDFQQSLLVYNQTLEDLIDIALSATEEGNEDRVMNVLIGIQEYIRIKSNKIDDEFEKLFKDLLGLKRPVITPVQEDENGDSFIELTDEIVSELGWSEDTELEVGLVGDKIVVSRVEE